MNKEQIVKDFSELYIGQNPQKLANEHYQKKRKEIAVLAIAAILIVSLCVFKDWQNSRLEEGNTLRRNNQTEGKEEIPLQVKRADGKWQELLLILHPKEYAKEELEQLYGQACEKLWDEIKNENSNPDMIISDLNLVTQMEGYPFVLRWESSKEEILDENGCLQDVEKNVEESISLTVSFEYEDWEREYIFPVHISIREKETFLSVLEEDLKRQEQKNRDKEQFVLPKDYENESVEWRYPPGKSGLLLGGLFLFLLPFISNQKDKEIHNQTKKRREELQDSFSEFVSKLVLLMEVGMSSRRAVLWIAQDYQKRKRKKKEYLGEELMYVCRQMNNGLSEKDAYELLAKRCNLASYTKLSGLLIQHLQKGGSCILDTLRVESTKAGEEKHQQIKKKGEEMGTKLLFPMIIMLGIVMVFIMVPALFSFQM